MNRALLTLAVLGIAGGSGYAYYHFRQTAPKFTVTTSPITLGDVVETVGATGTLQPVTTVQVGTQVSGTVQALYADFNSLVKKGQVLARLDPSLFQTQIDQGRANLIRAQADLERLRVSLDDARTRVARARELAGRQLIPKSDLDAAEVNVRVAEAQLRSAEAQVTQAKASLNQNEVNLTHTVIEAPIDGLVISRNVDVGQTVAASMQAPTLFLLAADLTEMQVVANLDESDVGRIRPGQAVSFRVDAYPTDSFSGTVSQVRLEPKVQQNVVTYATVIDVPNPQLKLKPGMTANVNIEIARRNNVVRVPNSALRFRPTNEMYVAIGQSPPDPASGAEFGAGRRGAGASPGSSAVPSPSSGREAAPAPAAAAAAPARGSRNMQAGNQVSVQPDVNPPTSEGGGSGSEGTGPFRRSSGGAPSGERPDLAARMENMPPEQREQLLSRLRARGMDPSGTGITASRGEGGKRPSSAGPGTPPPGGATTIDALFGPLPQTETPGRVWLYTGGQLRPVRVRVGISDGQVSELIEGDLQPGTELVTNISTGNATRPSATQALPFGQPGRGAVIVGFPGGGGGNRGGGR
jgi:HlyD family secretion protein